MFWNSDFLILNKNSQALLFYKFFSFCTIFSQLHKTPDKSSTDNFACCACQYYCVTQSLKTSFTTVWLAFWFKGELQADTLWCVNNTACQSHYKGVLDWTLKNHLLTLVIVRFGSRRLRSICRRRILLYFPDQILKFRLSLQTKSTHLFIQGKVYSAKGSSLWALERNSIISEFGNRDYLKLHIIQCLQLPNTSANLETNMQPYTNFLPQLLKAA